MCSMTSKAQTRSKRSSAGRSASAATSRPGVPSWLQPLLGDRPGPIGQLHPRVGAARGEPARDRALAGPDLQHVGDVEPGQCSGDHVPAQVGVEGQGRKRGTAARGSSQSGVETGGRGLRGELLGGSAGAVTGHGERLLVEGEVSQRVGEGLGVARRHGHDCVPEGTCCRCPGGHDRAPRRQALVHLRRHDALRLGPGAEDAQADVVPGDEVRQVRTVDPVQPAHSRAAARQLQRFGEVLAVADHRELDGVLAQQVDGPADRRSALQRGEQSEEDHAQDGRPRSRVGRSGGRRPGCRAGAGACRRCRPPPACARRPVRRPRTTPGPPRPGPPPPGPARPGGACAPGGPCRRRRHQQRAGQHGRRGRGRPASSHRPGPGRARCPRGPRGGPGRSPSAGSAGAPGGRRRAPCNRRAPRPGPAHRCHPIAGPAPPTSAPAAPSGASPPPGTRPPPPCPRSPRPRAR